MDDRRLSLADVNPRPPTRPRLENEILREQENVRLRVSFLRPELLRSVISFLDVNDLCAWDLVSKAFSQLSSKRWGDLAHCRFGVSISSGKKGWILGVNLMKEPILLETQELGDFGCGDYFSGSPTLATNQSILVTVSDEMDGDIPGKHRSFPVPPNGICIRDASNLSYFRTVESPICNWNVAICGRLGCEIFITSNGHQYCAIRGSNRVVWSPSSVFPVNDTCPSVGFGLPLLGCESHLITVVYGRVYLYDIDTPDGGLVTFKLAVPISEELLELNALGKTIRVPENIEWSQCESCFTFFEPTTNIVCIWKFEKAVGSIHRVRNISTDLPIRQVALTEKFVVGADRRKKLHVWCRERGEVCYTGLCDVPEEEQLEESDLIYPLYMVVVNGDLLATTSQIGVALCFWNVGSAKLLKRHDDAIKGTFAMIDELPDGVDATSMVHLKDLNAFFCCQVTPITFAFPLDPTMRKRCLSIHRRERNMKRAEINLGQGEMRGDDYYDD